MATPGSIKLDEDILSGIKNRGVIAWSSELNNIGERLFHFTTKSNLIINPLNDPIGLPGWKKVTYFSFKPGKYFLLTPIVVFWLTLWANTLRKEFNRRISCYSRLFCCFRSYCRVHRCDNYIIAFLKSISGYSPLRSEIFAMTTPKW